MPLNLSLRRPLSLRHTVFPLLAIALGSCITATAQTSARKPATGPTPVTLTPAASERLDVLDGLTKLPLDRWHIHGGDIEHGEDPALDDSAWELIAPPYQGGLDAQWFRTTVTVPPTLHGYDLSGSTISFRFDVDANGPVPLIIYFNGRRVAMGEDLEPIVLFDHARPGDKVLIAVKALHTVDKKSFQGVTATIAFDPKRPNPEEFATEARCAQILLPSVDASDQASGAALNGAIEQVSLDAMTAGDQARFDASLVRAQTALAQLRPKLTTAFVRITGNAHIDAAWLWPMSETVDVTRRTFATALQLMHEYEGYTFSQSAAQYSEWIEEKYPDEFAEIQQRVKEGRWEIVGGMWIEPDLNMPDGESLVRQLLVGKRYFQQKFGVEVNVGWNPDSFGYNWQLPQIYKKSGVDYFVTQKMWWNDTNQLPLKLFWWQSPDGSRVLTYFPHDYVNEVEPVRIAKDFSAARSLNPGTDDMMHLYGIGDHGGGPTRAMLDSAVRWMSPDKLPGSKVIEATAGTSRAPVLQYSVAGKYFADVLGKVDTANAPVWNYRTLAAGNTKLPTPPEGRISLPIWNDELYFEYHRGVMTTQAKHKQNMRDSEEWLLNAEKWSSLAWLNGAAYPAEKLNEAWKKVLLNQFHDLAAGSGIGVIYKDAQRDYDVVHWTADQATRSAMDVLNARIDTRVPAKVGKNAVPVVVWNPLGWSRTDLVRGTVQMPVASDGVAVVDASGKRMASFYAMAKEGANTRVNFVAEDVPSLGYKVFYLVPSEKRFEPVIAKDAAIKSPIVLTNEFLTVTIDPANGCITHLVDKKSGADAIAAGGCGNQLQTFVDKPHDYDAWNIDPGTLDHYTAVDVVDSITYAPDDGFGTGVTITRHFGQSKITQSIGVLHGVDRVTVDNTVDWHETHVLLKAAFPLAATAPMATFEIPYGAIERPTTRNNSFEQAKFEVPAMRWADEGDGSHGFSLLNNGKYGYDAVNNWLRLSLLRSPTWPDANADRGVQHFTYFLYPHAGTWQQAGTVRAGWESNYTLTAAQAEQHPGDWPVENSFVQVTPASAVLTAVKKAEDSDAVVLRVYNSTGEATTAHITFAPGFSAATAVNLMEKAEGQPFAAGKTVDVPLGKWAIETVEVTPDRK